MDRENSTDASEGRKKEVLGYFGKWMDGDWFLSF